MTLCVMVERLLIEGHNSDFTVTPPHAVDSLGRMRTVGPGPASLGSAASADYSADAVGVRGGPGVVTV